MSQTDIINQLKKATGSFEAYHKTFFECYRNTKDGNVEEVFFEILDAGSDVDPQLRYQCVARTSDGKMATGNPASSLDEVISQVHWYKLDAQ